MRLPCAGRAEAGLYLQLVSGLCAAGMGLAAKLAGGQGLPVMEIVLARSIVVLLLSGSLLLWQGRRAAGQAAEWPWRSSRRWLLLVRGLVGFGAITCYYSAVQLLPLADAAVFAFLAPLFVALLSPLVLGESSGGVVMAAAAPLCAAGVLLVAQPTFLFGGGSRALSMAGAVFMASAKFCVRILGRSEPVSSIMFSMAALSVAGSAALACLVPGQALVAPRSAAAWGALAAAGLLACCVQTTATWALKLSKATPTTMMSFLGVIWGLLGDLLVYNHPPSGLGLLGAALVCSSSLVVILAERRQGPGGGGDGGGGDGSLLPAGSPHPGLKAKDSRLRLEASAGYLPVPRDQGQQLQLELAEGGRLGGGAAAGEVVVVEEEDEDEDRGGGERVPLVPHTRPSSV
ncbi:hypothetical protein CHLNCDRAFT_145530 [Chlorella variabilis]|uniref:EamA domain-containing protein n=1 Tax=Chlorella variabilis TaxID=554065 RepID=E1ZDP8_CHLVA|nr:hypothetical protein CHLNCDRAFT_145530 [Chlorella variabilis]EFN56059.1 hypothetical protein CHLNCDRAFT_145530 [Chlorella variabilis]|eukprot:XP_005848161.1 hypothetical protein CHLNCDRAFT_145530 [Chlorella variabilis]